MSKVRTLVLLAAGLVAMPGARAELTIEITEGVSDPIPIAIAVWIAEISNYGRGAGPQAIQGFLRSHRHRNP